MKSFFPRLSCRIAKPVWLALLALVLIWFIPSASGQDAAAPVPTPSLLSAAKEVNEAGYSLKPSGLSTSEWPNVRLDFSIERTDRTIFKNLTLADAEAKLDSQPIGTKEGDLVLRSDEPATIFILLDVSGSMSATGVDKLRAAKAALKTLIDNLRPADRVGLIVFDDEQRPLIPVTADKELLKREIEGITIRKEQSRFTRLYDAVDFALQGADNNQNIILISDGWEDTPKTRELLATPAALEAYKQTREQQVTENSRKKNVRVFTVAIGDEHGTGLNYVDRAALANIANGANGGKGSYIEVTNASLSEAYLLSQLQQTLEDLRQSFLYSYSLTLHLDQASQRDDREHRLWIGFTVGNSPRVKLPVEYTYVWTQSGPPVVKAVTQLPAIFIQSAPPSVRFGQLLLIYLALLSVLIVLACLPAVGRLLAGGGETRRLHKAIVIVGKGSPLVGSQCQSEQAAAAGRYLIKEGDVLLVCPNPDCRALHHLSCWRLNDHHCMNRVCGVEMIVPPETLEQYGLMERELA